MAGHCPTGGMPSILPMRQLPPKKPLDMRAYGYGFARVAIPKDVLAIYDESAGRGNASSTEAPPLMTKEEDTEIRSCVWTPPGKP